ARQFGSQVIVTHRHRRQTIRAGLIGQGRARCARLHVLGRDGRTWDYRARSVLHSSQNCSGGQLSKDRNHRYEHDQPEDKQPNATAPTNTFKHCPHWLLLLLQTDLAPLSIDAPCQRSDVLPLQRNALTLTPEFYEVWLFIKFDS